MIAGQRVIRQCRPAPVHGAELGSQETWPEVIGWRRWGSMDSGHQGTLDHWLLLPALPAPSTAWPETGWWQKCAVLGLG